MMLGIDQEFDPTDFYTFEWHARYHLEAEMIEPHVAAAYLAEILPLEDEDPRMKVTWDQLAPKEQERFRGIYHRLTYALFTGELKYFRHPFRQDMLAVNTRAFFAWAKKHSSYTVPAWIPAVLRKNRLKKIADVGKRGKKADEEAVCAEYEERIQSRKKRNLPLEPTNLKKIREELGFKHGVDQRTIKDYVTKQKPQRKSENK